MRGIAASRGAPRVGWASSATTTARNPRSIAPPVRNRAAVGGSQYARKPIDAPTSTAPHDAERVLTREAAEHPGAHRDRRGPPGEETVAGQAGAPCRRRAEHDDQRGHHVAGAEARQREPEPGGGHRQRRGAQGDEAEARVREPAVDERAHRPQDQGCGEPDDQGGVGTGQERHRHRHPGAQAGRAREG